MFAAESYTSRHYIAIVAMACLCVLLGGPSADANPAAGEPTTGPTTNPALKPAAATTKTTTTVTKTTVAKASKPKAATATSAALPKTADNNWIAASVTLFLLGTMLLAAACRC